MTINLGDEVAYLLVPGWTGIVSAVTEELRGSTMVQVEHFIDKDGTAQPGLMGDQEYFEVITANKIPSVDSVGHDHIPLGALAKDVISGFKGTVTRKIYWLNGCVNIGLLADNKKEILLREAPVQYVQVINPNHYKMLFPEKAKEEPKPKKTGGPNLPVSRRAY